jgi:hypothetical protein
LFTDRRIAGVCANQSDDYAGDTSGDERDAERGRAHSSPPAGATGSCRLRQESVVEIFVTKSSARLAPIEATNERRAQRKSDSYAIPVRSK